MRIVFGTYNIPIKKYTATELGINLEDQLDYTFEVRQRIFHIFWIPIFPLYKIYAINKNGGLYQVPTQIEQIIKQAGRHKTPWYSFSLLIIGLIIFLGIGLGDFINKVKHDQYEERRNELLIEYNKNKKINPQVGDLIILSQLNSIDYNRKLLEDQSYIYKITGKIDGMFSVKASPLLDYNYNMFNSFDGVFHLADSIGFLSNDLIISKTEFQKMTLKENNNRLVGGKSINGETYYISSILNRNKPNLIIDSDSYSNGFAHMTLTYFGPIAKIKSIQPLRDIDGSINYSKILSNDNSKVFTHTIDIPANGIQADVKFKLTIENEYGKEYPFIIESCDGNCYIR